MHFYGSFSNDMEVKGLSLNALKYAEQKQLGRSGHGS